MMNEPAPLPGDSGPKPAAVDSLYPDVFVAEPAPTPHLS